MISDPGLRPVGMPRHSTLGGADRNATTRFPNLGRSLPCATAGHIVLQDRSDGALPRVAGIPTNSSDG
jgi:hypothetical protein